MKSVGILPVGQQLPSGPPRRLFRVAAGFLLVLLLLGRSAPAQMRIGGLIDEETARRYGLTRAWHTHIRLDRSRGRIAYVTQHISSTRTQTIYQVVSDRGRFDFSERALDKKGKPLGRIGAIEQAAQKIVQLVEQARLHQAKDADSSELTATQQAAEQVLQNIQDWREKAEAAAEAAEGAQQEEQSAATEPDLATIDTIVAPLMRRATGKPDVLPKLVLRVVPDIRVYVSTDQGVIHALDGETGRTLWAMPAGRPGHPNMAPAANDDYVAVVNGSQLFVIDAHSGILVWKRWLQGAPGASPAINDERIFVPMIKGKIESYLIDPGQDDFQTAGWIASAGRGLVRPTATVLSVGWPTDRGFFYVADAGRLMHRYRLESDRTITAPAAYVDGKFFVASIDGFLYCLDEMNGAVLWRFSTGQPISHQPIPIGDSVYVINEYGGMYRVNMETGQERWWTPQVKKFLAASQRRLYCADGVGRMLIIDANSGGLITTAPTETLDLKVTNAQTDRLLLGTRAGLLQCLHEPQLDKPLLHVAIEFKEEKKERKPAEPAAKPKTEPAPGAEEPAFTNPFPGGGTNPFEEPAKKPAGGGSTTDPFATGADPFGGGTTPPAGGAAGGEPSDPFAGGSNPSK